MRSIYFFLLFIALISCNKKNKVSADILPAEKMKKILWDVLRANALSEEIVRKDSTKKNQEEKSRLQSVVFSIYKIKKENFYKSYDFYTQHNDLMIALLDSTITYANKLRDINIPKLTDTLNDQE